MNSIDLKPAKHLTVLLTLNWGASTVRYARWDSDLVVDGQTFSAAPELAVASGEQSAGAEDVPFTATLRIDRPPMDALLRPFAHPPINASVAICDPYSPTLTLEQVWQGRVLSSVRNQSGNRRLVQLRIGGVKRRLAVPLGVVAAELCQNVFGDHVCGETVPQHNVTITGVDAETIEWSGFTPPRSTYLRFGEVEVGGLRLSIARQVTTSTATVYRRPPPEWIGAAAVLRPGCDRRIDGDCRTVWSREHRFTGYGAKMPNHNPIFEAKE